MIFRVPLLLVKSYAVIKRLDTVATTAAIPYAGATSGYDPDFREPISYDNTLPAGGTERSSGRVEYPETRVPCQVETVQVEDLQQFPAGDCPNSSIRLVFHMIDLKRLNLIDMLTNKPLIAINDRIIRIEGARAGTVTYAFKDPGLYIFSVTPGSFGFGPDGFDLYIAYLNDRIRGASK